MYMNSPYLIGTIDDRDGDRVSFTLAPPGNHGDPGPDADVTVWNQLEAGGPIAMFRGRITEVTGRSAAFRVLESQVPEDWPKRNEPMGMGNPVYLAIPGTFLPDPSRAATPAEMKLMVQMARDLAANTGQTIQGWSLTPFVQQEEGEEPVLGILASGVGDVDMDLLESTAELAEINRQARDEEDQN